MEFVTLLSTLSKVLLMYGPSALGWVVSAVLGWHIIRKSKDDVTETEKVRDRLMETKDEYIQKSQEMNDRLLELNLKHADVVNHITELRVAELRELAVDYNKLATSTLRTLDKFVVALEVRNDFRRSNKLFKDDDE
jgi:uncharacterized membrane-anchored protein YhcB (DUF1043 family)